MAVGLTMFKEIKGFKKEDLKRVAEEIGEDVSADDNTTNLNNILLNSSEYKNDPKFVKLLLQNTITDRKIEEGKEEKNQCLECRSNLLESIPSLLLKFRDRKYGIIADIKKNFLQISFRNEERNFLLFF